MYRKFFISSVGFVTAFCICFSPLLKNNLVAQSQFGYIDYSNVNMNFGDDIQAIAAKRFLPSAKRGIDRKSLGEFFCESKVSTIINGWYMHTGRAHERENGPYAPKKTWPPSSSIDPLLISIHFTKDFFPIAFSEEGIRYMKENGPVGARDYYTLHEMQKKDIPCYFSGCLTLTLENHCDDRNNIIYAVDISKECLNYIKSKTLCEVQTLTHCMKNKIGLTRQERMDHAAKILEKYKRAKCVITSRLHASMPCLAFETPVLLINTQPDQYRFDGLRELVRHCSQEEFLAGLVDFDFNNPGENPKTYLPLRENLISLITEWVNARSTK